MRSLPTAAAAILLSLAASSVSAKDVYDNFGRMTQGHDIPKEYTIAVKDRLSEVTVLAPHGGEIERGTENIAQALAGTDWNLYAFIAQLPQGHQPLHVTAAHFDDPIAVSLSSNALVAVAIHRQKDPGDIICIGGGNEMLRKAVAQKLSDSGFKYEEPCRRLPGESPDNIVNRARFNGVQLELSLDIGDTLAAGGETLNKFAQAIHAAVAQTLPKLRRDTGANPAPSPAK